MRKPDIQYDKYQKLVRKSFVVRKGKVVNVVGLTIESAGPDAKLGDLCTIFPDEEGNYKPVAAEVVGFKDGRTLLMPYDVTEGIGAGSIVTNTGFPLMVTVSEKLLGKTLNGLGVPLSGGES